MTNIANIGIIGCGNISRAYFENIGRFTNLKVTHCVDLDQQRAQETAAKYGITAAKDFDELLADPKIDAVINLTIPQAHAEISRKAFAAGKHVFSEKPMALNCSEAQSIIAAANKAGKRFGCAPDTVLGAGTQTARQALDSGMIGRPVAFAAALFCGGHEHWHPSPEFYYQAGGGPVLDMGPYYLHALIQLLGPVKKVSGMARISFPEREILSEPKRGQKIKVEVPTHVLGLLEFASGVSGTLSMSFDIKAKATAPVIEIYGENGTLKVPDPNQAYDEVFICNPGDEEPQPLSPTHAYTEGARGLGVSEMMAAIAANRPHRANESIAYHAMEIMESIHKSAETGQQIQLHSTTNRPEAMPPDGKF
jgi:predicted dehydrogenase